MAVSIRATSAALLASALLAGIACAPARASSTQEPLFQDDTHLIYGTPQSEAATLDQLAQLGVRRVRVTVIWRLIAPSPGSSRKPNFDARNPNAYPSGVWDRYDTLVRLAYARGIGVDFNVSSPDPDWAATSRAPASGFAKTYAPSAALFRDFVTALGRRYSGSFVPPAPAPPAQSPVLPLPSLPGVPCTVLGVQITNCPSPPQPAALPRVSYWSIWNEPDEGGWLTPQWRLSGGRWIEAAAVTYRSLLDAAWQALRGTGHGGDTILIGELAAKGADGHGVGFSMKPMPFIRALYCVGTDLRPLRGSAATARGCPAGGEPEALPSAHPALFQATGFAHHPYSFSLAPWIRSRDPDYATLADLGRLEHALDAIFADYGQQRRIPLYFTEYGYQSRPPDPYVPFSQAQQAEFINYAEYVSWRDPRVRAFTQFLLYDDQPKAGAAPGSRSYWSTFQTGLIDLSGNRKPAYAAYQMPLYLPTARIRRGQRVTVWGMLRPASPGTGQTVLLEFRRAGQASWRPLADIPAGGQRHYYTARVAVPGSGVMRASWVDPATGQALTSRSAPVSVR